MQVIRRKRGKSVDSEAAALAWLAGIFLDGIPQRPPASVVARCEMWVKLPGSALSSTFSTKHTPWVREPIECSGDGVTREDTFVAPIQSGKSTAGEAVLCDRIITQSNGDIQYNWQNGKKADERWLKRIEPILLACEELMKRAPKDRNKWTKGLVMFPHLNLTVQGVFTDSNVASDSIRTQINEELHDADGGWFPGRLQQAYGRLTAYWDSFVMNVSNAGYVGDQLHQVFHDGTQQHWMVKCPGCRQFHILRTEWDDKRPDLGGLRYDSQGCKRGDFEYDYNRLESTIRYQMPCGYVLRDDKRQREALSETGRYSEPTNSNAHISKRSFTLEGVSVHYIPWLKLIQEKHVALKALRYGDIQKWAAYKRERECKFWDPNDRPFFGTVTLNSNVRKTREGLKKHPGFRMRLFSLDRQRGNFPEPPHWWLAIRDVAIEDGNVIRTLLVYEGKVETDENVIAILDDHECERRFGVADSGDDTRHVYQFCYANNINAIKGGKSDWYSHPAPDGGRKIFSPPVGLHTMINAPPKYDYIRIGNKLCMNADEPRFFQYAKAGIRNRLEWLRTAPGVKWETPEDVSDDYQKHMKAEELQVNGGVEEWVKLAERNDLFVCECYIAMQMEIAGLIGAGVV